MKKENEDKARKAEERAKEMQDFVDKLMEIDKRHRLYEPEFLHTVPERHLRVLVRSQKRERELVNFAQLKHIHDFHSYVICISHTIFTNSKIQNLRKETHKS